MKQYKTFYKKYRSGRKKEKGYRFIFGYRFNDVPVYHPPQIAGEALEVEVIGSQVNYYKRF